MTHEKPVSRRRVLLAGALAGTSGLLWPGGRAGATTPQVNLTFDSGRLGPPVTAYRGATVARAYGRYSDGCRLRPLAANGDLAYLVVDGAGFTSGLPWASFAMWFRCASLPATADQYMNLFEIGNSLTGSQPKSQFTVYFCGGRLVADFNRTETMDVHAPLRAGQWHCIQAKVFFGATRYVAKVRFDHGTIRTLSSAADKTPSTVRALWVHYPSVPVDYVLDVDSIRMSTAATEPGWL